jgi:hypothetical protein
MFQTKAVKKNKTLFFFNLNVYSVKKYCTAGQATDDNMTHAHFMLDT